MTGTLCAEQYSAKCTVTRRETVLNTSEVMTDLKGAKPAALAKGVPCAHYLRSAFVTIFWQPAGGDGGWFGCNLRCYRPSGSNARRAVTPKKSVLLLSSLRYHSASRIRRVSRLDGQDRC